MNPPLATLNSDLTVTIIADMGIHTPGFYTVYLVGKLVDYDITEQVPFYIKVLSCQSTIDVSGVRLPLVENTWYSETVSFNMDPVGPMVVQEPACGYPLSFHAFWYDEGTD